MIDFEEEENEKYKNEFVSVIDTLEELKMFISRDLQMRFSLKYYRKNYEEDEMNRVIVLAFQVGLYLLGEYNEDVDYSYHQELEKSFKEVKEIVEPRAKEVIKNNKEVRELIFRFNKVSSRLYQKLYPDKEEILNNPILKSRDNILNSYFTDPNEYPEPESTKRYLTFAKQYINEVKELEKVFKKTF